MIQTRPVTREDEPLFKHWLANDKLHQSLGINFDMLFEDGTESFLISDEMGPLMFLRRHKAVRFAIQFNPKARFRSAKASREILDWLKHDAEEIDATEIICRPGGGAVRFAEKLGFEDFNGKVMKC